MSDDLSTKPLRSEGSYRLVTVQPAVYSTSVVLRAVYRMTGQAFLHVQSSPNGMEIRLRAKDAEADVDALVGELLNDLIDQSLRETIGRETEGVRDLILAHALSATNLIHPELESVESSTDPLGIGRSDAPRGNAV